MGSRCDSPEWRRIVPEVELEAFDSCLDNEPIKIKHLLWFTGGFSGSPVALIRVVRKGEAPAEEILKFCKEVRVKRRESSQHMTTRPSASARHTWSNHTVFSSSVTGQQSF